MGKSKIKFGDKIFLYGQFMDLLEDAYDYEYNSVMGYILVGGYVSTAMKTDIVGATLPGFVAEYGEIASFTSQTPFHQMEMVDVTDKLSLQLPLLSGTKVWMPTTRLN